VSEENKYPNPPADMGELLQRIQREWHALKEAVLALPQERLNSPGDGGWAVKDHLAHLSFWEQMLLRSYIGDEPAHSVLGVSEEEFSGLSEDAENDIVYRRNKDRDAAEVLSEVWGSHDSVVEAISRVPFERFGQPRKPGEEYPLGAYVRGNTYGHYMEHAEWLRPLMGQT